MAHSIWNDLCKQPTLKTSSEKYAHLVHDSTTQLLQSYESILSALDRRAMAFTKSGNFESALHDANLIQQLSPSSALGYLREADVYSEQGKQRHVIDTCNKGLDRIDKKDTHYATLQHVKEDATQRQSTCIDFIKQLPTDIVITTLIPMLMDNSRMSSTAPSPYLYVSNLWRDRIVQCFNGLRFDVGDAESHNLSHVVELSQCIKQLDVCQVSDEALICDLLRNNDFCSLRELYVDSSTPHGIHQFVSSLKSIGRTLTHFDALLDGVSIVSIADIMQSCPNLVSFDVFQQDLPDFISLQMTTWPKLTTFSITCNGEELFTRDHITAICKHFPSLKKLSICPCEDPQMTRIVLDHYPRMKCLELLEGPGVERVYLQQESTGEDIGITDLHIEMGRDAFPFYDVFAHELRQHQNTLERFKFTVFNYVGEQGNDDHLQDIYTIEYRRLKKLELSVLGGWIPRNAPILEELKMTANTIREHMAVLDTIPPKLKKLQLHLDNHFGPRHTTSLERYLQRFPRHCQLKELVIHFPSLINITNILNAIHGLHQLERLMISFTAQWDHHQMESFIDGLVKGCSKLACLEIKCFNAPSTYSMNALKQLEHLERFAFSIRGMDGDDGFWQAIQTLSQLKCIRIYPAKGANMDAIRRLQGQRLDLKIYLDRQFTRFEDSL